VNNKRAILLSILLISAFLLSSSTALRAESDITVGGTIKLYSSVYTQDDKDNPFDPHEAGDFFLNRGELRLKVHGYASDNVSFSTKLDYIYTSSSQYDNLSDLETSTGFDSEVYDSDLNFREALFKVMDVFTEGMDLIVGRQRVRWGTSDELNVIDNLNPVDYAGLFSFDPDYFVDHVPMDGLTLEYQSSSDYDLKFQGVYFVSFKPSPLPVGYTTLVRMQQQAAFDQLTDLLDLPPGVADITLGSTPENDVKAGPRGLRLSGNFFNFDLGLSYYYGHQVLPLPEAIVTTLSVTETSTFDLFLGYPRLDVFGFDLAGEVRSVGVWGEVGVYLPENKDVEVILTAFETQQGSFPLLEQTYTKLTVGFDYTFDVGDGLYWNTQ